MTEDQEDRIMTLLSILFMSFLIGCFLPMYTILIGVLIWKQLFGE